MLYIDDMLNSNCLDQTRDNFYSTCHIYSIGKLLHTTVLFDPDNFYSTCHIYSIGKLLHTTVLFDPDNFYSTCHLYIA